MKSELLVFLAVALVAVIPLLQISFTGMQTYSGLTLAEYPKFFFADNAFNAAIIKGNMEQPGERLAANTIANQLSYYTTYPEAMQNKIIASSKIDYRTTDAIIIGIPCHNYAVSELLGISNCNAYFKPGDALIKIVEANNHKYVVVTGYSGDDVFSAASLLESSASRSLLPALSEIKIARKTYQEAIYIPLQIGETIGHKAEAITGGY